MLEYEPITVVETPEFLAATKKLMDDDERSALVDFLAVNPMSGDVVQGTGGVRKLRWALEGRGKRGGSRVIYFFHDMEMPLFAFTVYAKNERADLSASERAQMKKITAILVEQYKGKRRKP